MSKQSVLCTKVQLGLHKVVSYKSSSLKVPELSNIVLKLDEPGMKTLGLKSRRPELKPFHL